MKKALLIIVFAMGLSFVSVTHAVNISISIPTQGSNPCATPNSTECKPGNIINSFYQFSLMIGGLLAFAAVVYGGVRYITSGGNPSSQSEAKEWIWSALLGLTLLFGAFLILNTINPNLTTLNLPTLQSVAVSPPANACGTCPSGTSCLNGSCATATGMIYCGGTTNAPCQDSSQTCVNAGTTLSPSYSCQTIAAGACSGTHYSSSGCAPPELCTNNGTNQKPNYQCALH